MTLVEGDATTKHLSRVFSAARTDVLDDLPYLFIVQAEAAAPSRRHTVRRYFERWMESWDDYEMGPTEFRSGRECVVTGVAVKGRGRGSGIDVAMNAWHVWRIHDGRAARCEEYPERTEALEAAGLSE